MDREKPMDRPLQPTELKWKLVSSRWFDWVFFPCMFAFVFACGLFVGPVYLWCWLRGREFDPKTRTPYYSGRK